VSKNRTEFDVADAIITHLLEKSFFCAVNFEHPPLALSLRNRIEGCVFSRGKPRLNSTERNMTAVLGVCQFLAGAYFLIQYLRNRAANNVMINIKYY
jgi:hypothetical protein